MMFSFMLTDEKSSLYVCKHCEKAFVVSRLNSVFCSGKAELFGIDKSGISRHLAKIFESGELDEEVVVAKIATTTQHGAMQDKTQTIPTNYYNLDAIISVGYRVNSIQATRFRIWATGILKEYMVKGKQEIIL